MANPTVDGVVKVYRTAFRKWLAQPLLLQDLGDVNVPTPADNEILAWDSGTSKWINQTPASLMVFDTLDNDYGAETITSLFTFDRSPFAPFAVTAGSARVTNLDADLLDGLHASSFAQTLISAGGVNTLINDSSTPSWALKGLTEGTGIDVTNTSVQVTIAFDGVLTHTKQLTMSFVRKSIAASDKYKDGYGAWNLQQDTDLTGEPTYHVTFSIRIPDNASTNDITVAWLFVPDTTQTGVKTVRWRVLHNSIQSGDTSIPTPTATESDSTLVSGHTNDDPIEKSLSLPGAVAPGELFTVVLQVKDTGTDAVGGMDILGTPWVEIIMDDIADTGSVS